MGSDTCGSIRIPAANNNLVGLRGTRGLASGRGIVPLSTTQDIGGPLARTLGDLALMLDATVGPDPEDPSSAASAAHIPRSYVDALRPGGLKGARLGVLELYFGPEEDGSAVVRTAIDEMKKAGAEIVEVQVPGLEELLRDSSVIASEFKFDLAAFLAAREDAPVKSLDEILKQGLYDASMETTLTRRNAVEKRDSEEHRVDQARCDSQRGRGRDGRTPAGRAALSHAAPQAGAHWRRAAGNDVPTERGLGAPGAQRPGGVHGRRPANRSGVPRACVE
jgi:Asp-tRNA(Asn)/Glu-tRNA(Gln) amidotransferase A subunit family amidase